LVPLELVSGGPICVKRQFASHWEVGWPCSSRTALFASSLSHIFRRWFALSPQVAVMGFPILLAIPITLIFFCNLLSVAKLCRISSSIFLSSLLFCKRSSIPVCPVPSVPQWPVSRFPVFQWYSVFPKTTTLVYISFWFAGLILSHYWSYL
jgi:hypothetical protein